MPESVTGPGDLGPWTQALAETIDAGCAEVFRERDYDAATIRRVFPRLAVDVTIARHAFGILWGDRTQDDLLTAIRSALNA